MPSLNEIGPVVLEEKIFKFRGGAFYLNKIEYTSPMGMVEIGQVDLEEKLKM